MKTYNPCGEKKKKTKQTALWCLRSGIEWAEPEEWRRAKHRPIGKVWFTTQVHDSKHANNGNITCSKGSDFLGRGGGWKNAPQKQWTEGATIRKLVEKKWAYEVAHLEILNGRDLGRGTCSVFPENSKSCKSAGGCLFKQGHFLNILR